MEFSKPINLLQNRQHLLWTVLLFSTPNKRYDWEKITQDTKRIFEEVLASIQKVSGPNQEDIKCIRHPL